MGSSVSWACALLAFAALMCGAIGAEEAVAAPQKHYLTDIPSPLSGVESSVWFASHPSKQLPAGEQVDVVFGLRNNAEEAVNITFAAGSLNFNEDFNYYLLNFTQKPYWSELPPGAEISFEYSLIIDPRLPQQREYILALTAFYQTTRQLYATTFFNGTVDVVEPPRLIDTQAVALVLILAALAVAIAYTIFSNVQGYAFVKKAGKKKKVVDAKPSEADQDEWLKGTFYDLNKKKKAGVKKVE